MRHLLEPGQRAPPMPGHRGEGPGHRRLHVALPRTQGRRQDPVRQAHRVRREQEERQAQRRRGQARPWHQAQTRPGEEVASDATARRDEDPDEEAKGAAQDAREEARGEDPARQDGEETIRG